MMLDFVSRGKGMWGVLCLLVAVVPFLFTGCYRGASIVVDTEPKGGSVYVDGAMVGQAPHDVAVSPSTKNIRVVFQDATSRPKAEPPVKPISRTLKAAYIPLTANLPLFVALEKGFFEQNGVKVNALEATSPNDIATALVNGDIDFSVVLAYPIIFPMALRFPDAFKLYSSSEETSSAYTSGIIVKQDSPIKSYEELRGKKIGVYTGIVQINFLKAVLTGMGIKPDEVEIIEISPRLQIQGLVSDQYDALSSTEPTTNIARIQGIARTLVEAPRVKFIMCPFPSSATAISTKLLTESPDAAKAVVQALNLAIDYIRSDPEDAKKCMVKYTPIPDEIADKVLADLKLFKYCKLGEENRLNVQRFADYLAAEGMLDSRIEDVNRLFGDFEEACGK